MGHWAWERGRSALMVSVLMHETHRYRRSYHTRASVAAAKYTSKGHEVLNIYEDNPYLLYYVKKNLCFDKLRSPLCQLHSSNNQCKGEGGDSGETLVTSANHSGINGEKGHQEVHGLIQHSSKSSKCQLQTIRNSLLLREQNSNLGLKSEPSHWGSFLPGPQQEPYQPRVGL